MSKTNLTWNNHFALPFGAILDGLPVGGSSGTFTGDLAGVRTFDSVAGWREKIKLGQQATGPFHRLIAWYSGGGQWTAQFRASASSPWRLESIYGAYYSGAASAYVRPTAAEQTLATDIASARYIQKVREARTKVQGGTVLVELAQTIRQIRSPLKAMTESALAFYERINHSRAFLKKFRSKRKAQKFIANAWLEVAYGWKPLIADVIGASQALSESIHYFQRNWSYVRATATVRNAGPLSEVSFGHGRCNVLGTVMRKREFVVKHLGLIEANTSDPVVMGLAQFGFSPEEWLPTGWEIIPYSFLLDYIANFNDMIYAWSYRNAGHRWLQRTTVEKFSSDCSTRAAPFSQPDIASVFGNGCAVNVHVIQIRRSIITASDLIPNFRFKVPGLPQTLNSAALLHAKARWKPLWT